MKLSGDVRGKRVVVAHPGDVAVMKVEDGREMVDVDFRTDAGEVPSGLCWGFVGGWLLRRRKSAKTAAKNPDSLLRRSNSWSFFQQRRFPPPKKRTPPAEPAQTRRYLAG